MPALCSFHSPSILFVQTSLQLVVMENLFYEHAPTRVFDLKGSARSRYVQDDDDDCSFEEALIQRRRRRRRSSFDLELDPLEDITATKPIKATKKKVLLDDNFIEWTQSRPFPLRKKAKEYLDKAVSNDAMFLSAINVVDYSILVGIDENSFTLRFGIIDYMRQYDIIKKMEHMGKSVGMLTGQAEPTIIEPAQYKRRLQGAMDRYFMGVPDKWSTDEDDEQLVDKGI